MIWSALKRSTAKIITAATVSASATRSPIRRRRSEGMSRIIGGPSRSRSGGGARWVALLDSRNELVANRAHGADEAWIGGVIAELASKPAHVDVDRSVDDARVIVPMDRVDQIIPAEHASRTPHETDQQAELERSQLQRRTVEAYLDRVRVDLEAIGLQDRLISSRIQASPAQEGPDAGHELPWRERLDHVVVRPYVEPNHLVRVT